MIAPKTCHVIVQTGGGVSNATTLTITLPFTSDGQQSFTVPVTNNSLSAIGSMRTTNSSAIATCWSAAIGTAWASSNNKGVFFSIVYNTQ
jgi:hypothetical protein